MRNLLRSAAFAVVLIASLAASPSLYAAGCFGAYANAVESCSNIPTWGERTLCGLDAGLELTGCIRRAL